MQGLKFLPLQIKLKDQRPEVTRKEKRIVENTKKVGRVTFNRLPSSSTTFSSEKYQRNVKKADRVIFKRLPFLTHKEYTCKLRRMH